MHLVTCMVLLKQDPCKPRCRHALHWTILLKNCRDWCSDAKTIHGKLWSAPLGRNGGDWEAWPAPVSPLAAWNRWRNCSLFCKSWRFLSNLTFYGPLSCSKNWNTYLELFCFSHDWLFQMSPLINKAVTDLIKLFDEKCEKQQAFDIHLWVRGELSFSAEKKTRKCCCKLFRKTSKNLIDLVWLSSNKKLSLHLHLFAVNLVASRWMSSVQWPLESTLDVFKMKHPPFSWKVGKFFEALATCQHGTLWWLTLEVSMEFSGPSVKTPSHNRRKEEKLDSPFSFRTFPKKKPSNLQHSGHFLLLKWCAHTFLFSFCHSSLVDLFPWLLKLLINYTSRKDPFNPWHQDMARQIIKSRLQTGVSALNSTLLWCWPFLVVLREREWDLCFTPSLDVPPPAPGCVTPSPRSVAPRSVCGSHPQVRLDLGWVENWGDVQSLLTLVSGFGTVVFGPEFLC